jgi:hypothetical protein
MTTPLRAAPSPPKNRCCDHGHTILVTAQEACASFLQSFDKVHKKKRGAATSGAGEDLLRAMLVFASSGLDAMIKQLISDALPILLQKNDGAIVNFQGYVEKHLLRDQKNAASLMSKSLTSSSPRTHLITWFCEQLSSDSLQSKDQVLQIGSYFDIPSAAITTNIKELEQSFRVRNKIIHEMDVDLGQPGGKRTPRKRDDIVASVNLLLEVAEKFLSEVDKRVS